MQEMRRTSKNSSSVHVVEVDGTCRSILIIPEQCEKITEINSQ